MTPDGWKRARLGEVAELSSGSTPSRSRPEFFCRPGEGGVPWVKTMDLTDGWIEETEEHLTAMGVERLKVNHPGTVLIAMYGGFQQIGRSAILKHSAATNQAISALSLRRSEVDPEYCNYWLVYARPRWKRVAASSRKDPNVTKEDVARFELLIPPLGEQRKITAILSSVDDAIEATQAVIDQLGIVKKAMMAELLTRGLPGRHTRFTQTQIGEVPEEWEVASGESIFSLSGGYGPADVRFAEDGEALFLKVDDFNLEANQRGLYEAALRFKPTQNPRIRTCQPGSLVFPKRGAAIFKSRVQVLKSEAAVDPNLMVLAPGPRLDPAFFAYEMLQIGLHNLSDNSGIPQLNNKHLYPHPFAVPTLDEQCAIRDALGAVDQRLACEQASNSSLQGMKRALMSVLLTGEVRVKPDEEAA